MACPDPAVEDEPTAFGHLGDKQPLLPDRPGHAVHGGPGHQPMIVAWRRGVGRRESVANGEAIALHHTGEATVEPGRRQGVVDVETLALVAGAKEPVTTSLLRSSGPK